MYIIIVGAGNIGQNIADYLYRNGYDITVVDIHAERLKEVSNTLDVQTMLGHGADRYTLDQIRVQEADFVLAVTDDDEVNMLIAFTAKRRGAQQVAARVRNQFYLERASIDYARTLNIDLLISPERLAAQEIIKFLDNPAALTAKTYARGLVEMRQYEIEACSSVVGIPLMKANFPEGTLVAAISRQGNIIIPRGHDCLQAGDIATIVGLTGKMQLVQKLLCVIPDTNSGPKTVVIGGGGDTGVFVAETLVRRGHSIKIIDNDLTRCHHLCDHLNKVTVLKGDVTDLACLSEEHIGQADFFVATTGDDENNFMSCLLVQQLGDTKTCCLVDRPAFVPIIERCGVHLAVSPRQVTADQLLAKIKGKRIHSVSVLEDGQIEIIEFQVPPHALIDGKNIEHISFPEGTLLATVVKNNQVCIPRGNLSINSGDIVIGVALSGQADALEKLFEART